jgi:hypothetical protein
VPAPRPTPAELQGCIRRFDVPARFREPRNYPELGRPFGGVGSFVAMFDMEVDLADDPARGCVPGQFEYRQLVRGRHYRRRRGQPAVQTVLHRLPDGSLLNPATWGLDGSDGALYGRRLGQANEDNDRYLPEPRLTGWEYRGHDEPGILIAADDDLVGLDLEFRGLVIYIDQATNSEMKLREAAWVVADVLIVSPAGGGPPPAGGAPTPPKTGLLKGTSGHADEPRP